MHSLKTFILSLSRVQNPLWSKNLIFFLIWGLQCHFSSFELHMVCYNCFKTVGVPTPTYNNCTIQRPPAILGLGYVNIPTEATVMVHCYKSFPTTRKRTDTCISMHICVWQKRVIRVAVWCKSISPPQCWLLSELVQLTPRYRYVTHS